MEPSVRVCESCGESYDFLKRDVEGDFHFLVMRVLDGDDGALRVIGHWRTGLPPRGHPVELRRTDGHRVEINELTVVPNPDEKSARQGQRELAVRTSHPDSFHAGGCIHLARAYLPIGANCG